MTYPSTVACRVWMGWAAGRVCWLQGTCQHTDGAPAEQARLRLHGCVARYDCDWQLGCHACGTITSLPPRRRAGMPDLMFLKLCVRLETSGVLVSALSTALRLLLEQAPSTSTLPSPRLGV